MIYSEPVNYTLSPPKKKIKKNLRCSPIALHQMLNNWCQKQSFIRGWEKFQTLRIAHQNSTADQTQFFVRSLIISRTHTQNPRWIVCFPLKDCPRMSECDDCDRRTMLWRQAHRAAAAAAAGAPVKWSWWSVTGSDTACWVDCDSANKTWWIQKRLVTGNMDEGISAPGDNIPPSPWIWLTHAYDRNYKQQQINTRVTCYRLRFPSQCIAHSVCQSCVSCVWTSSAGIWCSVGWCCLCTPSAKTLHLLCAEIVIEAKVEVYLHCLNEVMLCLRLWADHVLIWEW